jgi:hypothetical protein
MLGRDRSPRNSLRHLRPDSVLLPFEDAAAKVALKDARRSPGVEASDQLRVRPLRPNEYPVAEAVLVEPAAKGEVLSETVALPDGFNPSFDLG